MNIIQINYFVPKFPNTIYLDKDGVLNRAIRRNNKISSPRRNNEIEIKKDLTSIKQFAKNKFNLVIISNQPDVSRKLINKKFLYYNLKLIKKHIPICSALICPHLKSMKCDCRKPKDELIRIFRGQFPNSTKKELFIGDQPTDQKCALNLKIKFIKVKNSFSKFNSIKNTLKKYNN